MKTCLTLAIAALALTGSTVKSADPDPCEAIGYLAPTPLYQGVGSCPEHERNDIKKAILRICGMQEDIYRVGFFVAQPQTGWQDEDQLQNTWDQLYAIAKAEAKLGSKRLKNEMDKESYDLQALKADLIEMSEVPGTEQTIFLWTTGSGSYFYLTDRGHESFVISGRERSTIDKVMWKMAYDLYTNNGDTKYFNLYNYAYYTGGWKTQPEYYRLFVIGRLQHQGYINFNFFDNSANPEDDERVVTLTDKGHIWFANNIGGENLVFRGTRWDWRWLTKNHSVFREGVRTIGSIDGDIEDGAMFTGGHFLFSYYGELLPPGSDASAAFEALSFMLGIGLIDRPAPGEYYISQDYYDWEATQE